MSIVPIADLSLSDIARLGNNLLPKRKRTTPRRALAVTARREVLAVRRSLASVGESIVELYPPPTKWGSSHAA